MQHNIIPIPHNNSLIFNDDTSFMADKTTGIGYKIGKLSETKLYQLSVSSETSELQFDPKIFSLLNQQTSDESIFSLVAISPQNRPRHRFDRLVPNPYSLTLLDLHLRANRMNISNLKRLIEFNKLSVSPKPTDSDIKTVRNCRICRIVNAVAGSRSNQMMRANRVIEVVHSNTMGPIMVQGKPLYVSTLRNTTCDRLP